MHNFRIFYILWDLNPDRITSVVVQAIRLQYHLQQQKYEKRVFLKKLNKRDRTLIKSYRIISFLNCLGKIVEKVVAKQLSQFCKKNKKFYKQQIEVRNYSSVIDVAALLIQKIQEVWQNQKIAGKLFINIKRLFGYVFQV